MFDQSWPTVYDVGRALVKHLVDVSCLFDCHCEVTCRGYLGIVVRLRQPVIDSQSATQMITLSIAAVPFGGKSGSGLTVNLYTATN